MYRDDKRNTAFAVAAFSQSANDLEQVVLAGATQLAVAPEPAPLRSIDLPDGRRAGPVNLIVGRLVVVETGSQ